MKFYKCEHCGNIIAFVENKGVPILCCGMKMTELVPNTVEASSEKHLPIITSTHDGIVEISVGAVNHPMLPEHFIDWLAIETKQGNQRKPLSGEPQTVFALVPGDELIAVYAYCNLHGLWKTTV